VDGEHLRIREAAVEWRAVDGEVVALVRASGEYIAVNSSGALLWPLLVEGTTGDELVEALVQGYRLERGAARRDVGAFVAALRERALLESDG
jgi:hypothetical protein